LPTIVRTVIAIFASFAVSVVVTNWHIAGIGFFVTYGPAGTRVTTGLAGSTHTGFCTVAKQTVVGAIRVDRTLRLLWIEKLGNGIPVVGERAINGPVIFRIAFITTVIATATRKLANHFARTV
jgi:hypothetical protein